MWLLVALGLQLVDGLRTAGERLDTDGAVRLVELRDEGGRPLLGLLPTIAAIALIAVRPMGYRSRHGA